MIRIESLSKSFGIKSVLSDVSFHFPEGQRMALVGANGAGKTTFLDILTGVLDPDSGKVLRPSRLKLGYLPQEPSQNPCDSVLEEVLVGGDGPIQVLIRRHRQASRQLEESYSDDTHRSWDLVDQEFRLHDGYALEGIARSILKGLGFRDEVLGQPPKILSGGWRMRVELAKLFLNKPNFLILDEPTNHLDLPSLVWVENWLKNYDGTLLFVSHDQSLLRRLPTMTLHLHAGQLLAYQGNFDQFLEERAKRQSEQAALADGLKRRREHLEQFVERFGAKASKASQAQSKLKMISRIRSLETEVIGEDSIDSMSLSISLRQPSGREVVTINNGAIGYEGPLCRGLNLLVERGQKIAVIGANGIGKSTLLKTIAGQIQSLGGEFKFGHNVNFSWFAQDQLETLDQSKTVLENILASSTTVTQQAARNILGALLFHGDDVNKLVRVLSGGEKARVGLARLLVQDANFLLLDEPTNHLDISSCEILSQALKDYPGTVMFVSHDRQFIDSVCSHVFAMLPDGRGHLFEGLLDDYQRQAEISGFPDVLRLATDIEPHDKPSTKTLPVSEDASGQMSDAEVQQIRREIQRHQKRINQLEILLARHQDDVQKIDHHLASCGGDFQEAQKLATQKNELEEQLKDTEAEWLTLAASVEDAQNLLKKIGRSV
jgi:ATP-binding cassette, subfamily F, member 3